MRPALTPALSAGLAVAPVQGRGVPALFSPVGSPLVDARAKITRLEGEIAALRHRLAVRLWKERADARKRRQDAKEAQRRGVLAYVQASRDTAYEFDSRKPRPAPRVVITRKWFAWFK